MINATEELLSNFYSLEYKAQSLNDLRTNEYLFTFFLLITISPTK